MEANNAASVANRNHTTERTAGKDLVGFNCDDLLTDSVLNDGDVNARDIEKGIGTSAPARATTSIIHVRVSCECLLWSLTIQRDPDVSSAQPRLSLKRRGGLLAGSGTSPTTGCAICSVQAVTDRTG
ncbi:hypothetical protein V3C33_15860 [Micrococcaceae bacterium Sec5.7]